MLAWGPCRRAVSSYPLRLPSIYTHSRTLTTKPLASSSTSVYPTSYPTADGPVELTYTSYIPESGNETEGALVILHGLLGSKRNWGSLCKLFQKDMPNRPVYALDLRNHGTSPQVVPMGYSNMTRDVAKFIDEKGLKDVALMGHSMGGKAAMAYALGVQSGDIPSNVLSKLIVVDIAPSIGKLSPEFPGYIRALQQIDNLPYGAVKTRGDADKKLRAEVQDLSVRQFLLTNLEVPSPSSGEKPRWIVPLDILAAGLEDIGSFPFAYDPVAGTVPVSWTGPTLGVKGIRSPYINHKNLPAFRAFFPNMRLEQLDADHWVHAEKPTGFRKLIANFLEESN